MATAQDVLRALESIAPSRYKFPWDKIGLQVGDPNARIEKAVVSLDRSWAAAKFCQEQQAQLLLAHHPLIFEPLNTVDARSHVGRTILTLIEARVAFIAAHTNWDVARGGVNDALAELLGLVDVKPFGQAADVQDLKLVFFCPPDKVEGVVDAVSGAGAGVIGAYSRCAFMSGGTGTFLGDETTHPAVGQSGTVERVEETRVEMVLPQDRRSQVVKALIASHPYEEPAYDLFVLAASGQRPAGRIGSLPEAMSLARFADFVDQRLGTKSLTWGGRESIVKKVALTGGGASSDWIPAQRAGADVFVTGEAPQHVALEASESGLAIMASGHYATEQPGVVRLAQAMGAQLPEIEWLVFEPAPGQAGRPF